MGSSPEQVWGGPQLKLHAQLLLGTGGSDSGGEEPAASGFDELLGGGDC